MADMSQEAHEIEILRQAFESLAETSRSMEGAYSGLQERVRLLHQELEEKNLALALTADYLGNLLESMSDGVIAVDMDGCVSRFNRAASSILGFGASEVLGKAFDMVFDRPFDAPPLSTNMALRAKSGRRVPIHERDAAIRGSDGKQQGRVKVFQDLSELHALREQARQNDRLAAIGEMAAAVAHEIRNPLGGIRGFAAFLAQDLAEDPVKRRLVDKILEGTNRLDAIVSELLEYTRPVELQLRPVRCAAILEQALTLLTYDAERIEIRRRIKRNDKVLADPDKIMRVFLNILINAVQSIEGRGRISISSSGDDRQVVLSVRDTGCGMDAALVKRVFSPFFTTKEKGTGLGLSISLKIVEGHGGGIKVESAPGRGAVLRVALPRAE